MISWLRRNSDDEKSDEEWLLTTHFNGNRKPLQNLVTSHADDMNADHSFLRSSTDELIHRRLLVLLLNLGEVEGGKVRLV